MKILANQKIKALFCKILLYIIGFSVFFIVFMQLGITLAALYIGIGACVMGFLIILACYGYFKEQNEIMEKAVWQIREYISGSKDARNIGYFPSVKDSPGSLKYL